MTKNAEANRKSALLAAIKVSSRQLLESSVAVLPIVALIVILYFTGIFPKDEFTPQLLVTFVISAAIIIIGLSAFNFGTSRSMTRIGEIVGQTLFRKRKLSLVIIMTFIIGVLVTIAEPD